MSVINVVIADSETISHAGIRHFISQYDGVSVKASILEKENLDQVIIETAPDLLVADPYLTDFISLQDIKRIEQNLPSLKTLIISSSIKSFHIYQALTRGIKAYLSKSCSEVELEGGIKAAVKDERFFCRKTIDVFMGINNNGPESYVISELTEREEEVMKFLIQGKQSEFIAEELNISYHTIVAHRKNILKKFKVNSSIDLILKALEMGMIPIAT